MTATFNEAQIRQLAASQRRHELTAGVIVADALDSCCDYIRGLHDLLAMQKAADEMLCKAVFGEVRPGVTAYSLILEIERMKKAG